MKFLTVKEDFHHILHVLNTNADGKQKIMFALTSIKSIGRLLANIVCKKADADMNKSPEAEDYGCEGGFSGCIQCFRHESKKNKTIFVAVLFYVVSI